MAEPQAKSSRVHYPQDVEDITASEKQHQFQSHSRPHSSPPSVVDTDDDQQFEAEEYDWSGDEDLEDEEAKFEDSKLAGLREEAWSLKYLLRILFTTFIGAVLLAVLLALPAVLVHFLWYKPHPDENRDYIKDNVSAWLYWAAANVLISWALAFIVDVLPTFLRFLLAVLWGRVSDDIKANIEFYYIMKDDFKPVLYAASMWASWVIIFQNIFGLYNPGKSPAAYTDRLSQVVEFIFFLALVYCVCRVISHIAAYTFHQKSFSDRIAEVRTAVSTIEALRAYHPPRNFRTGRSSGAKTPLWGGLGFGLGTGTTPYDEKTHFSYISSELAKEKLKAEQEQVHDAGEDADTEELDEKNVKGKNRKSAMFTLGDSPDKQRSDPGTTVPLNSPPFDKRPGMISRASAYFDKTLQPPQQQQVSHGQTPSFTPGEFSWNKSPGSGTPGAGSMLVTKTANIIKEAVLHDARNISKTDGAAELAWDIKTSQEAKRLARNTYMKFQNSRRTYLIPSDFYPAFPTKEEAEAAFHVFDKDSNGDISRSEIKQFVMKIYKERRFLSRSMRDVSAALKSLDNVLFTFGAIILLFVSLSVFGVDYASSLTSIYSIGLAASFIFKNSASNLFDAVMFLFVTHPYDTGDMCFIDDEVLIVKKMTLFATIFTRVDGTDSYYFNSQLFNKFITNVRRSGNMYENLTMQVAWNTPNEKLDALEAAMLNWLQTDENRWFEPSTKIIIQNIEFQRYMEFTMLIMHKGTWQDWGLRWVRRTAFHAATKYYCQQLGIKGYEAPLPIVWADTDTMTYVPDNYRENEEDYEELMSPDGGQSVRSLHLDEQEDEPRVPTLGFIPPSKVNGVTRARKSKRRKNAAAMHV